MRNFSEFCSGHNIKDFFLMLFSYSRLMSPEVFNDAELRCAEINQRSGKKESKAADSWLGSSEGSPRSQDKVW